MDARIAPVERRLRFGRIPDRDPEIVLERPWAERLLDAYSDMRWATRALLRERPGEARLLVLALTADLVVFLARSLTLIAAPVETTGAGWPGLALFALTHGFLLRTALLYPLAAAAKILSWPFGGRGSWRDTRAAVIWAAFVAAPVDVVGAVILLGLAALGALPPAGSATLAQAAGLLGPIAFGFFLCAGVAEAQGFRYTYRVMIAAAAIALPLLWGALVVLQG